MSHQHFDTHGKRVLTFTSINVTVASIYSFCNMSRKNKINLYKNKTKSMDGNANLKRQKNTINTKIACTCGEYSK